MCLLFTYLNPNPQPGQYRLVVASSRDEYYDRPTGQAHYWPNLPDQDQLLGGMDQKPGFEGGTWLAMNCTKGHVAVLLNVRIPQNTFRLEGVKGRGSLVPNFLYKLTPQANTNLNLNETQTDSFSKEKNNNVCVSASALSKPDPISFDQSAVDFFNCLQRDRNEYNGFVFVTFKLDQINQKYKLKFYHSFKDEFSPEVDSGIHAFGNNRNPCLPWPKMEHGKKLLEQVLIRHNQIQLETNVAKDNQTSSDLIEDLFSIFQDRTQFDPQGEFGAQMPEMSLEDRKMLSSINLHLPQYSYGTRTVTLILVDRELNVEYVERTLNVERKPELVFDERRFDFRIGQSELQRHNK